MSLWELNKQAATQLKYIYIYFNFWKFPRWPKLEKHKKGKKSREPRWKNGRKREMGSNRKEERIKEKGKKSPALFGSRLHGKRKWWFLGLKSLERERERWSAWREWSVKQVMVNIVIEKWPNREREREREWGGLGKRGQIPNPKSWNTQNRKKGQKKKKKGTAGDRVFRHWESHRHQMWNVGIVRDWDCWDWDWNLGVPLYSSPKSQNLTFF